jgi:predicted Zn-dependent protease
VLALGGFVAGSIADRALHDPGAARRDTMDARLRSTPATPGEAREVALTTKRRQAVPPEQLRRRIENLKPGSYIDDVILAQDSALYRWPDRATASVQVWIEPESQAAGWDPSYPALARAAFGDWTEAGFPLRFNFLLDSSAADIRVRWKERFPPEDGQRIGVTERIHTSDFWIASAHIDIANHDSTGRLIPTGMVGGILRHEIGHALGLNHANDPTSVMYREYATTTISPSDRATLRLLYLVTPGSLR